MSTPKSAFAENGQLTTGGTQSGYGMPASACEEPRAGTDRFEYLAREASDIISSHTPDGRCLFVSSAVQRLLGWTPEEYVAIAAEDLVPAEDFTEIVRVSAELAEGERAVATSKYRMRHKDGHSVWFESKLRPIWNEETGELVEIITVARDITARIAVEEQLIAARHKAEAANQAKSRFLANMSHELRTPLNAVIGFSDLIRNEMYGPVGSDRYIEYASLIHESGTLLLDLISDILDMAKIEAGKYELVYESVYVNELAQSMIDLVNTRARDGGVTIERFLLEEDQFIRVDRRALKQIILNLLSNAIKFTPKDGTVTVSVAVCDDEAAFIIEDTGVGIREEDLERVTRPFEQVADDPSTAHNGSGLGLALVQSLIELHGGALRIDSEMSVGTKVTVTLPLTTAE